MHRTQVKSSNLVSVGYDAKNASLDVEFVGGSVYRYYDVPESVYQELSNAPSSGKYFSSRIKGSYTCMCLLRNRE